jgi:hypothetical protein
LIFSIHNELTTANWTPGLIIIMGRPSCGQLDQYQTRRLQYHTFRLILSIFFHVLTGATVMTKPPRGAVMRRRTSPPPVAVVTAAVVIGAVVIAAGSLGEA